MRGRTLLRAALPVLLCLVAVLWLVWGFIPWPVTGKLVLTLVVLLISAVLIRQGYRQKCPVVQADEAGHFPPESHTGPVVLICGDVDGAIFAGGPCRGTAQGWYLRIAELTGLTSFAECLLARTPAMAGQLAVMYRCLPDQHEDEALLRASLKALRLQMKQLRELTGYNVPLVLNAEFSGPETPWIVVRGNTTLVCPDEEPAIMLSEWQQWLQAAVVQPYLTLARSLLHCVVLDELGKVDRLYPAVLPFAVTLRFGALSTSLAALWPQLLFRRTCIAPAGRVIAYQPRWHFADAVLPLLAPYTTPLQGGKTGRRVVMILLLCVLGAIVLSVRHNQSLIRRVSTDLQRWQAIPMNHYVAKSQALHALQQDALLLERWQRQGEPHRYGLGLYSGNRLWLAVQQAIDTYVPPPPPPKPGPKPVPKIVRLDSMSLFDSGSFDLRPGSTKLLVNSLVGIRGKPGWLIVVAGHTDNTGKPALNQTLSLKRAEAVRDWMRDTGDVPESCFAVQGYGASRPIATNDTPQGRALNRRVEISLVPQANACQRPGPPPAPSQNNGAL
ncbi:MULTISPECIES: OmpA family protein [unclassified Tatumella]|uniref:OmpA family protein n=1 Tax=unclassified Tatumella TaxID=2649542 RepID=UPI001BAF11BB|nr:MULTISPECIES: OmpA family protein [unclassified Tatumella]MBS0878499.1 OmpA family protein [Tatumella sp. JGM82]MBS0891968.1 OmpA family protein [Tatumella sp. JGM94]MBS0903086.1 OmpA family protein [Tatumella sp. JGM100]